VVILILALVFVGMRRDGWAQQKKIVYWTHWEQNTEFNKWYETKGKEFAQKTGYEVEVVTIPFQGYEAKYLAALMGKSEASDFLKMIQEIEHPVAGNLKLVGVPVKLSETPATLRLAPHCGPTQRRNPRAVGLRGGIATAVAAEGHNRLGKPEGVKGGNRVTPLRNSVRARGLWWRSLRLSSPHDTAGTGTSSSSPWR
jgi:hypothetical protein